MPGLVTARVSGLLRQLQWRFRWGLFGVSITTHKRLVTLGALKDQVDVGICNIPRQRELEAFQAN